MNARSFRFLTLVLSLVSIVTAAPAAWAQSPPHDIVVVFDNSGSMKKNDPAFLAKSAAIRFVERLSGDVRLGIVVFDHKVRVFEKLRALDDGSRPAFLASLDKVDYRGQFTRTASALERALWELDTNGRKGVRQSVVLMTDGIVDTNDKARDVESIKWMRGDLAADAADRGIKVYGVAFTENADFMTLQSLARRTDASYFRAPAPADLAAVFDRLNDELARVEVEVVAPPAAPVSAPVAQPELSVTPPAPALPAPTLPAPALPVVAGTTGVVQPEVPATSTVPEPSPPSSVTETTTAAPAAAAPAPEPEPEPEPEPKAEPEPEPAPAAAAPTAVAAPPASTGIETWILASIAVGFLLLCVVVVLIFMQSRRSKAGSGVGAGSAASAATVVGAFPEGAFLRDMGVVTGKERHELTSPAVVVGRQPLVGGPPGTQSVVIERNTIGRQHAWIEYRDHGFWIRDHESLNGTFVNDQRLAKEPVLLKSGDRVRFYDVEFRFGMVVEDGGDKTVMAGAGDESDRTVLAGSAPDAVAAAVASAVVADAVVDQDDAPAVEPPSDVLDDDLADLFADDDEDDVEAAVEEGEVSLADAETRIHESPAIEEAPPEPEPETASPDRVDEDAEFDLAFDLGDVPMSAQREPVAEPPAVVSGADDGELEVAAESTPDAGPMTTEGTDTEDLSALAADDTGPVDRPLSGDGGGSADLTDGSVEDIDAPSTVAVAPEAEGAGVVAEPESVPAGDPGSESSAEDADARSAVAVAPEAEDVSVIAEPEPAPAEASGDDASADDTVPPATAPDGVPIGEPEVAIDARDIDEPAAAPALDENEASAGEPVDASSDIDEDDETPTIPDDVPEPAPAEPIPPTSIYVPPAAEAGAESPAVESFDSPKTAIFRPGDDADETPEAAPPPPEPQSKSSSKPSTLFDIFSADDDEKS